MTSRTAIPAALCLAVVLASTCTRSTINDFVKDPGGTPGSVVALTSVTIIDGTGTPAQGDSTIVLDGEKIAAMGKSAEVRIPSGAKRLDLPGRTVIPGLVGMHDHLFYHLGDGTRVVTPQETFANLYLASGVTTIRTGGAVDFEGDLRTKHLIEEGKRPGPTIHVTSPYLHARSGPPDPEGIARDVNAWADRGATSFKAYMTLRRDELKAAIEAAHARGLKVTGHLCAVGFREAASLGIDNLEHGLLADTEFYARKEPDVCPDSSGALGSLRSIDISGPFVQQTIATLVRRGVAITSTLAVYETFTSRARLDDRALSVIHAPALAYYRQGQARITADDDRDRAWSELLRTEMAFERAFVAAGGRLVAGVDPTGWGGVMAGFGDQRQVQLLVDAGFTPEFAIRIASANGAALLNDAQIGYLAPGMQADLVVVRGNLSRNIDDLRNVEIVFKKGIAYDPDALIAATCATIRGSSFDLRRISRWPYGPLILALLAFMVMRRVLRRRREDRRWSA